jgi:hypothetical protein
MGAVYSAYDAVRQHPVALKRLLVDANTRHREERIALFHGEYRTLAELDHPCVIAVYDYGLDAEGPYYTMELLSGSDLSGTPRPWREACSLVRDICSSLALLHSRGYVHRDVSPLNVRCTQDGRAKLIDFGAMVPMGVSALTIGTPSCIAPEALKREPLDGRTDLFALGATLYFSLTGQQAFPARTLLELRTAHRRTLRPPSAIKPELPHALDRLVLSLLSVDPMARPRHASEVMERLTVLADLAPFEQLAEHEAYLNTPALVGRAEPTRKLNEAVVRLSESRGGVVRLSAAAGGGRSRMLQAAMTEARLLGLTVLSADATDATYGAYGVLRALLTELRDTVSKTREALERAPGLRAILAGSDLGSEAAARESIMREVTALIAAISHGQPMLIAVDDIERSDEPSLAALLSLAASLRRGPIGILYTDSNDAVSGDRAALSLLRELSNEIALEPLSESDTETLLGSVFGQVHNLSTVARHLFQRAAGNPRSTMELAQTLVERKLARYELGSWSLPGQLAADALPASLADVRRAKLDALHEDARELANMLAVLDRYGSSADDVISLADHGSAERIAAAQHALIEARVVSALDPQTLADRGWIDLLRERMEPARSRLIHARLAERLVARRASPIALTRCLFAASQPDRALDALCGALTVNSLVDQSDTEYPDLLLEALTHCKQLERPTRDAFSIRLELVALADRVTIKGLAECFHSVLRQLTKDSGWDDWERLGTPSSPDVSAPPAAERLTGALTAVQARYDASPLAERVLSPIDAIRILAETVYAGSVYSAVIGDPALIRSLPTLEPFVPLSPAISGVIAAIEAQKALIGARYEDALELYHVRLEALETSGLSEVQLARSRPLLTYAVGALQAGLGIEGALERATELDSMPQGQILASAVREAYCLRRGNLRGVEQWRRRRELLQIQQKRAHELRLRQTTQLLECAAHAEDLEQTKRNVEVLQELTEFYPSAQPYLDYGRAEYERIRGNYTASLMHVRRCLDVTQPAVHPAWPWAAGCEIDCLRLRGELNEAHTVGVAHIAAATASGLRVMRDHIECFLALVEGELGLFDVACERLDRGIAYREQYGMHGLNLGWCYEARAQLALLMKDRAMFEHCMRRCAASYQGERDNPALLGRHQHLMQRAREIWEGFGEITIWDEVEMTTTVESAISRAPAATTWHRLLHYPDREQRAAAALGMVLSLAKCEHGRLYLLTEQGLTLVAGPPDTPELHAIAKRWIGSDEDEDETGEMTVTGEDELTTAVPEHGPMRPVLLSCERTDGLATVGVVALSCDKADESNKVFHLARELSHALIDFGDVKPRIRADFRTESVIRD